MYCKKCKKEILESSGFCPHCGSEIGHKKKNTILSKRITILWILVIFIVIIVLLLVFIKINRSSKFKNNIAQENYTMEGLLEGNNLTSQIMDIEAIDNVGNNKILKLDEDKFTNVLKSDLNTIANEYLVDVTVESFLINALYNKNENNYAFIHYIIYYTNSQNQECYLCVARTGEDYLLPYNAVSNNGSTILVPDNVLNSIVVFGNKMSSHEYNENYCAISISENINTNIYSILKEKLDL